MQYKVVRKVKREGKYEVWVDVYDDAGKLIIGNHLFPVGAKLLSEEDLIAEMDKKIPAMLQEKEEEGDIMISKAEVEKLLVDKGYLQEGETLEDLKDKDDLTTTDSKEL